MVINLAEAQRHTFVAVPVLGVVLSLVLLSACDGSLVSASPPTNVQFAKAEIHYTKSGGWISTSKLDIYGNGLAWASVIPQWTLTPHDSAAVTLDRKEQNLLADLCGGFSSYNNHYEPKELISDMDFHVIVFIYGGVPDTVSIYDPHRTILPLRLRTLLAALEDLHTNISQRQAGENTQSLRAVF